MRLKKLGRDGLISLGLELAETKQTGVVSLSAEDDAIKIRPYREGDEADGRITIKCLDSRGRIILPRPMAVRTKIDRVAEVEVHEDGSISLRPSEKCRDCPYRV